MPKQFIGDILHKFSKATNILKEVAKIQESLDEEPVDLDKLLQETKIQVESLSSFSQNVQKQFDADYEKICEKLSSAAKTSPRKPRITLVDISKLVNPVERTDQRETKALNSSVVVISSEEDELEPKETKRLKKPYKPSPKSRKEKRLNREEKTAEVASTGTVQPVVPHKETASNAKNKTETRNKTVSFAEIPTHIVEKTNHVEVDKKLSYGCFVKLLRVPCEEMKSFYQKRLEIESSEMDSNNPKRTRRHSTSSDENGSECNKKKRKKQVPTKADTINESIDVDESRDESTVDRREKTESSNNSSDTPTKVLEEENPLPKDSKEEDTASKSDNSDLPPTLQPKIVGEDVVDTRDGNENVSTFRKENSSTSDSEEEFDMLNKKKREIQNRVSKVMKKKMKKKIIHSDSESYKENTSEDSKTSEESDSDRGADKEPANKKKTKSRLKKINDSSDDEDDKKTRKQIRGILANDSLAEATKKAEAEEKERKFRIAEKQKKYNQKYGNTVSNKDGCTVEKVVLDYDEATKTELLRIEEPLLSKLKPHQASGIQFMWDACFESLNRAKKTQGSGCILAHCMGLGKTLQVIALVHALLSDQEKTGVRKVMVVCPLNTVLNWVREFKQWLPDEDAYDVFELVSKKQILGKMTAVKNWHDEGGVLIIGYDMFRNLTNPNNARLSKRARKDIAECMVDPGPDLVICDEGHLLKNEKTNTSIAMNRLRTQRRIVLTGTPLQNNLKEYFCMVQFVKPNLLGTYKEYLNRFVNPITNGQYTDSTQHDIAIMRKRSHVLHKMLDGVVQRRDYAVLAPYLPPKFEYVLFLNLTETQINLYQHYMEHYAKRSTGSNRTSFLFVDYQALQRICTHPKALLDKSIEDRNNRNHDNLTDEDSEGSLKDFIDDGDEASTSSSDESNEESDKEDLKVERKGNKTKRLTRAQAAVAKDNGEDVSIEELNDNTLLAKEWWQEFCDGDDLNNITYSSKLYLLFEILKECEQMGDKVLVFSQSLYSLNIIEYFLNRINDATEDGNTETTNGYTGSWILGLDYFRLDGSSSCDNRSDWCQQFNEPSNTRARLFLISTRAGGLGINLVAANRVIIFDVSWNPSHDIQSIYRVYRFGQKKPSYVYRFVTYGTMEMKIYERQVTKQAISKRVIDEQQIDRHYNQNDLQELYKFEPRPSNRPIPMVPKDVLLGELLQKHEDRIFKYHEHQSLLENKEEECLNEEERKLAWEEFENEKIQRQAPSQLLLGTNMMSPTSIQMALARIIQVQNPGLTGPTIKNLLPQLFKELQDQVQKGNMTFYNRVRQEIYKMHQENVLRQQQLFMGAMQQPMGKPPYAINGNPGELPMPIPGSSHSIDGVIDLND